MWPRGRVAVGPAGGFDVGPEVMVEGGVDGPAAGWTVERAVQPVAATAATRRTAAMRRIDRMAAPARHRASAGPQRQGSRARSRHSDEAASRPTRKGFDPVTIGDPNQHAVGAEQPEPPGSVETVTSTQAVSISRMPSCVLVRPASVQDSASLRRRIHVAPTAHPCWARHRRGRGRGERRRRPHHPPAHQRDRWDGRHHPAAGHDATTGPPEAPGRPARPVGCCNGRRPPGALAGTCSTNGPGWEDPGAVHVPGGEPGPGGGNA
jgi:hypothetical protein